MRFFRNIHDRWSSLRVRIFYPRPGGLEIQAIQNFPSRALERAVPVDVFLPPDDFSQSQPYPVLLFNDGQDMEAIQMPSILEQLYQQCKVKPFIVVAIHANQDRMHEYGVAAQEDYKKRGSKAKQFTRFVLEELKPELHRRYRCTDASWVYGGFSLGGLSAFDIVWHHPQVFSKVGVFSGSFWWRSLPSDPTNPDAHRIVQDMLARSTLRPGLKFWLQTGTEDENEDRNKNGVIDSIDDTLDVIRALQHLGYREGDDIHYLEVIGGEHNLPTWARVMPDFLQWAFGQQT